ncbi:TPA: hypothetical protein RSW73_000241 [Vibrio cholerae]|uniref:hypothetical protein n=1 Tax=Vibrio cholerae TaxID=666 RepID=UPI0028BC4A25|nr:hypothetical protein [Vibrio cholerae]HDZ3739134.1 hypothetical protein [Vibrio cholerae]
MSLSQMQQNQQQNAMMQMRDMVTQNGMQALQGSQAPSENPMEAIPMMIAGALVANLQAAMQQGKTIPPNVMINSAKEMLKELVNQMQIPPEQAQQMMPELFFASLEQFGQMASGMLNEQERQQYAQLITEIGESMNQGGQ